MAKNSIATAADKADFFKRLNGTTKRINPVTGERHEAPRLRDEIARQLLANHPAPLPGYSPCADTGRQNLTAYQDATSNK